MKVIVLAQPNDNHTAPIKWALQQAGYEVACWAGLSWAENQQVALMVGSETTLVLGPHTVEAGDTLWIRRPELPVPNPKVSEPDKTFAEHEYNNMYRSLAYMLEMLPVRCINKYSGSRLINNKGVQLHLARACGLNAPEALLSNSPQAVRNFFHHNPSRMICKAFTPHVWQRQNIGGVAITETFEITQEELPRDEILTYAPGIYQDLVVKQFDARTVLMGNRVYSFALHSRKKALDWRQDAAKGEVEVEIITTPPEVERGLLALAQRAGICFGSTDFAVDMEGKWWFLEINEEGQFLWLDQSNRAARTQEKFCAFLTTPDDSTESLEDRAGLFPSFLDYENFQNKQEVPDVAAGIPVSPFFSLEP